MAQPWFQRGYRRMLLDMHIPDWDPGFLAKYDPRKMVALYKAAGLSSVMFYAQSHVGLCYWPTKTGRMHQGLRGRDIVGETLALLRQAKMDACIYYSVIYNNWAQLEHPDWAQVAATDKIGLFSGGRYGRCCPNHPDYRAFALAQVAELLTSYRFDGIFYDMTFWPRVCVCRHCRQKFREETGAEIPEKIDWLSADWCRFQEAREHWMIEFAMELYHTSKAASPGLTVYHNFATAMFNWTLGLSLQSSAAHDLLGADFYGDPLEQLLVSKLMNNLAANRPLEFATSRCVSLNDHEQNKSFDLIRMQALASALFSGATMFIDAVNPDGTVNPKPYRQLRRVYDELEQYEPYLGGEMVEDVAIYFSSESKMDFRENGQSLDKAAMWGRNYPHLKAVRGACRTLQQAHLPFGVITRKQLPNLDRYKVVILPNLLRMDDDEISAFRGYVERGGRLYASRYTSLTDTCGTRHEDFRLAKVFGCRYSGDDLGTAAYLKMRQARLTAAIAPQAYLSHMVLPGTSGEAAGTLRLREEAEGQVLATLTLPYSLEDGNLMSQNWSSIHSWPPWEDTAAPAIVSHRYGQGRAIYSAADIECLDGVASAQLFLTLIEDLLGDRASATAEAHPAVWMSVTHQPEKKRFIVGFLNYQAQLPPIPIASTSFTLRPPAGRRGQRGPRFTKLTVLPSGRRVKFTTDKKGRLMAEAKNLEALQLLAAEYE